MSRSPNFLRMAIVTILAHISFLGCTSSSQTHDSAAAISNDTLAPTSLTSKTQFAITGTKDIACPVENWFALNDLMPNFQLIVLPQAGHGPQHQYSKLTAQYIKDFVKEPVF